MKFKIEALSYTIVIAITQICYTGIKKIVTLVHQTGNSNLVMHMHYMSKSISQGSGKYWELPSNTGKYREKLANTGK